MKKNATSRKTNTQAACRTAYAANASGTMIAKIAGISTAAVLAVSVPVLLHTVNSNKSAADNTTTISQRADISMVSNDKNDVSRAAVDREEAVKEAAEASSAAESSTAISEATSSADVLPAYDNSSKVETVKTVRESNIEAIDGSHVFTNGGATKTFGDLYAEGCANVSDKTDGKAMAIMHSDTGAGTAFYTTYYTTNSGMDWVEGETLRITNSIRQFFAMDNGDILMFRYDGPDYHGVPFIQIISQGEDNKPRISDKAEVLSGYTLDDGYIIHSSEDRDELVYLDFEASYNGGSSLHIDVRSGSSGEVIGKFDINTNDLSYTSSGKTEEADNNTTAENIESEIKETVPVDMTVDKLLSMSCDELIALSNEDFELVMGQGQVQHPCVRCAAFPNYGFVVDYDVEDGKAENKYQMPMTYDPEGAHLTIKNNIKHYELFTGAYVGEGFTVGMTYNEIKDLMGGELTIHPNNSSVGLSSTVTIDGRKWEIHYDLTEDQYMEICDRINEAHPERDVLSLWECTVDISDMNPTSDLAMLHIR